MALKKELIWTGLAYEKNFGYSKGGPIPWTPIVKVHLNGANMIFISGQIALDDLGRTIVPGSIKAQTETIYQNIKKHLDAAGAKVSDIVYERINVVNDYMHQYATRTTKIRAKWYADNGVPYDKLPALTTIGVAGLTQSEFAIEIEIIAMSEA
jgi:enamine deaminase RidA (YjgF/YER057c/UK114 family)